MMFRQPGEHPTASGHVIHGPFPTRVGLLGAAAAAVFCGALFLLIGLQTQRFHCAAEPSAMCTINAVDAFERSSIRSVRTTVERGSKNSKYGVVVIQLASSREVRL